MSIRRNNRLFNHGDTIVRTSPIPLTDGLTAIYYTNRYVRLTNRYFTAPSANWYNNAENTVIIKAEIPENATGYFFGAFDASTAMTIRKSGSNIIWKIGTTEYTRAWQPGVHLYGFSEGKAWYDNVFLTTMPYTGSVPVSKITIGGATNVGSTTIYECISEIDVYEVFMMAPYTNGTTIKTVGHLYATCEGAGGTKAWLFEMRRSLYAWDSYGSGTATLGDAVTYGVQLHDLKEAFGSGYRDLVGLMCEDWTAQATDGADPADILDGPSGAIFYSAFCLLGMPVPNGWTRRERPEEGSPETIKYAKGDLIKGRVPKWRLWTDNINVGKFGRLAGNGYFYFNYNIFNPRNKIGCPNLEQWEGYSTYLYASHTPFFDMGNGLIIEYHNSVACKADLTTRIKAFNIGYTQRGEENTELDDNRIFRHILPTLGQSVRMGLGNLVDWHKTAKQQIDDQVESNPIYIFTGISGSVSRRYPTGGGQFATRLIAAAWKQTTKAGYTSPPELAKYATDLMPLSSDTETEEVELFRDGKVNGEYKDWEMALCGTEKDQDLLYYETRKGVVIGEGTLAAIINTAEIDADEGPIDTQLCRTDWVMPITEPTFTANDNPHVGTDGSVIPTNYRCILMNETVELSGNTDYIYPLFTAYTAARAYVRTRDISNIGGFVFMFAVMGSPLGSVPPSGYDHEAVDISAIDFHLSLELISVKSNGIVRSFIERDFVAGEPTRSGESYFRGYYDSQGTQLSTLPYEINAAYQMLGSNFINPINVSTYGKGIFIPINDIPSAHIVEDPTTHHNVIDENTTIRMWIYPKNKLTPRLIPLGALYDWTTAMYKIQFDVIGGNPQYIYIDRTSLLNLQNNESPVDINFSTLDGSALDISVEPLTGQGGSKLCIEIYKDWQDGSSLVNRLCRFLLYKYNSERAGSMTPQYGYVCYGESGDDWQDNQGITYELEITSGGAHGMNFTITPLFSNWGNNNLTVRIYKQTI